MLLLGQIDLHFADVQTSQSGRDELDERTRAKRQFDVRRKSGFHRVRAANIGPEPITGAQRHLAAHGSPPLSERRPDDNDPLCVAHLADPAVVGQRFCDHELALVDRRVHRDQAQLGQRRPGRDRAGRPGVDRHKLLRCRIGIGGDRQLSVRRRQLDAVDKAILPIVVAPLDRFRVEERPGLLDTDFKQAQ